MRLTASLLLLLVLLPAGAAGMTAVQHNLSYYLAGSNISVEEWVLIENSPFSVKEPVYYSLPPGVYGVVAHATGGAEARVDTAAGAVIFDLSRAYSRKVELSLKYSYSADIQRADRTYLLEGEALRRAYPWGFGRVSIEFLLPPGYYFGSASPEPQIKSSRHIAYITDSLDSRVYQGFPVRIEYGEYRKLAEEKLSIASALEHETMLAVKSANLSISEARIYNASVEEAEKLLSASLGNLSQYLRLKSAAELALNTDPYRAYLSATDALASLKTAGTLARSAQSHANSAVQQALQAQIRNFASNLSTKPAEKVIVRVEREEGGRNWYMYAFFILLAVFAVFAASEAYKALAPRSYRRRGSIKDYRAITDLRRKTFNGFERKVERVKKGVDIASEIRSLRKRREKLELGIDNLRKKLASGEISEELHAIEKSKFEAEIEQIDRRLEELEKQLRKVKSGEAAEG
ncbi:MAG: hypothetical protein GXN98_01260 [Euryarchaeota archaeon]|nr:hypothetical protein [Euryarchaeota archaeon]